MKKLCRILTNNLAPLIVLTSLAGFLYPPLLAFIAPHISLMLGIIMFGMGITLSFEDFRRILKHPKEVALGALLQFTLMPLLAYILCVLLQLPQEIAIGVLLVGSAPGGTASNVLAYLAKGDVALSVSMSMVSTILAPVVTPALMYIFSSTWMEISFTAMMLSICEIVLVPLLLGILCHSIFGRFSEKVTPFMPAVSVLAIVLLVGSIVAVSADKLLSFGLVAFLAVLLHNALGLFLGYFVAKYLNLSPEKARTISIEVGTQNSGLAASLAVLYFNPLAAVPGAIFSLWQNVAGAFLAGYFAHKEEEPQSVLAK